MLTLCCISVFTVLQMAAAQPITIFAMEDGRHVGVPLAAWVETFVVTGVCAYGGPQGLDIPVFDWQQAGLPAAHSAVQGRLLIVIPHPSLVLLEAPVEMLQQGQQVRLRSPQLAAAWLSPLLRGRVITRIAAGLVEQVEAATSAAVPVAVAAVHAAATAHMGQLADQGFQDRVLKESLQLQLDALVPVLMATGVPAAVQYAQRPRASNAPAALELAQLARKVAAAVHAAGDARRLAAQPGHHTAAATELLCARRGCSQPAGAATCPACRRVSYCSFSCLQADQHSHQHGCGGNV